MPPKNLRFSKAGGPFEEAGQKISLGAADGIVEVAQTIMEQSLAECPVETWTLRRSARFMVSQEIDKDIEVTFGYGFGDEINPIRHLPASGYAVPVHERLEARHAPPTKAKFLEDPVLEHAATLQPVMAAAIQAVLTGTGLGAPSWSGVASGAGIHFADINLIPGEEV